MQEVPRRCNDQSRLTLAYLDPDSAITEWVNGSTAKSAQLRQLVARTECLVKKQEATMGNEEGKRPFQISGDVLSCLTNVRD